ncbi:MAG TPA: LPS export ABC transporter periplasmic protein LptC [Desulfuromonadaceae bacterium]
MASSGNIRLVLAILITAMVIGIVVAIALKGSKQTSPTPVLQKLPQNIDVALHQACFTEMREGRAAWELVADRAQYDKSGDNAYLSDIRLKFAKTRSGGAITVTAARGDYASKSGDVRLRGAVHMVTESGIDFTSESLDYLAARSLFRTAAPVAFRQQRLALRARGMEMDVKEQKARFQSAIDATVAGQ